MSRIKKSFNIEVNTILQQIKQLTEKSHHDQKEDISVYEKLNSYDKVMKKYRIDPLDQTALQIYQYLIEEQTIASLPTKSRIKIMQNSQLRFSRTNIQIPFQQSEQDYSRINQIQDPQHQQEQVDNLRLFSFAKNPHHTNQKRRQIQQRDLQPKQLFAESHVKSKSDIKSNKNYVHTKKSKQKINQQELMIFSSESQKNSSNVSKRQLSKQKQSNKNSKRSIKTIGHQLSVSGSQKILQSRNIEFNSQKTKEIQKQNNYHEGSTAQQLLKLYLKKKHFMNFVDKIISQKSLIKTIQLQKKVKYIYCFNILKCAFQGLKQNLCKQKQNNKKAIQFSSIRVEIMLEQYFLEWKYWTKLPLQTKQRFQQIQQKQNHLLKFLSVNRFIDNYKTQNRIKQQIQQQKKILNLKSELLVKKLFFSTFCLKNKNKAFSNQKICEINRFKNHNRIRLFFKNIKIIAQHQKQNERQKIKICIIRVKGKTFIQKLKNELSFAQAYWKSSNSRNQGIKNKKIVFLYHLLSSLKHKLQRMGYDSLWMKECQQNFQIVDRKNLYALSNYTKKRVFQRLCSFIKQGKQNRNKIKIMFMNRFLNHLTYSSYIQHKKNTEQAKLQKLNQYLLVKRGTQFINFINLKQNIQLQTKQAQLRKYILNSKAQQFFIYLQSYKKTKTLYLQKLEDFKQQTNYNYLRTIWYNFKRVLKEQIINKKLVEQYLSLKNNIMKQNCFQVLKNNVFVQKLFRKKQQNLNRFIKMKYFWQVNKKLTVSMKYKEKQKNIVIQKFNQRCKIGKLRSFYLKLKDLKQQRQLQLHIQTQMSQNYNSYLVQKCFKVLKFVTDKLKQQNSLSQQIIQSRNLKIKQQSLQKMIEEMLKRKVIKHFIKIVQKIQNRHYQKDIQTVMKKFKSFSNNQDKLNQ